MKSESLCTWSNYDAALDEIQFETPEYTHDWGAVELACRLFTELRALVPAKKLALFDSWGYTKLRGSLKRKPDAEGVRSFSLRVGDTCRRCTEDAWQWVRRHTSRRWGKVWFYECARGVER